MKHLLSIEKLNFSWTDNHVLKDVSFHVKSNELVAILGVNGVGKSTLLKCINRILNPESGEIKINENNLNNFNLMQLAKQISYVPQSVRTSFSMNVFDVVLLGRRPHIFWRISDKDRDIVSQTLKLFRLEDFAFRGFHKLSGGERQRVIIAKAVAQDPHLFLMDEPTSDLDLKNQIEVMKNMRELISNNSQGKSAIIAIHDINIAARFADRIILMHEGGILSVGKPEEVLTTENIEKVFSVTNEIIPKTKSNPMRVIVKDEINTV